MPSTIFTLPIFLFIIIIIISNVLLFLYLFYRTVKRLRLALLQCGVPVSKTIDAMENSARRSSHRLPRWLYSAIRRIPGYSFFLLHLCYIHKLWGWLFDFLLLQPTPDASSALALASEIQNETITELRHRAVLTINAVLRSFDANGVAGVVQASERYLHQLWISPSRAIFFFGSCFFVLSALLAVARVVRSLLWLLAKPCSPRRCADGARRPVPLHIVVHYGNGYDSVVRLFLAAVELVWFLSFSLSPSSQRGKSMARPKGATETTYAALRELQARQQTVANFRAEAALLLPPYFFESAQDAMEAAPMIILCVRVLLIMIVSFDAQRLFHALVGVRPLEIPNGWERCPVCGALWRSSQRGKNELHECPVLLSTSSQNGPSTVEAGAAGRGAPPIPTERPGDAFRDPNTISWWSSLTYSWIDSLLNFCLLAPFNTFAPPPATASSDGSRSFWKAHLRIVSRLPRLPSNMYTRDYIDEVGWQLWNHRNDAVPPVEGSRVERIFMRCTAPARHVLASAFALFFLPPAPVSMKTGQQQQQQQRRRQGLFDVFLRHPSGREFVFTCVPLKVIQDILSLCAPRVVRALVSYLKEVGASSPAGREAYLCRGLLISAALIAVVVLQALFFQLYLTHLYASSLKATSALKTLLLRQSLETPVAFTGSGSPVSVLSPSPSSKELDRSDDGGGGGGEVKQRKSKRKRWAVTASPTLQPPQAKPPISDPVLSHEGEAISLVTVDATNCGECLIFLHNVWGHPFLILSSLLSMYSYVGLVSTLSTFVVLIALTPLNRSSAGRVRVAQQKAKNNGSRLSDLTAALSAMRTVKSMALENCLVSRIVDARQCESEGTQQIGRAESMAAAQTEITTLIVSIVCCGSYLLTGGTMDAAVLVPTMAALSVMRFPVWTFPHLFSHVSRGYNSMKRIERFLSEYASGLEAVEEAQAAAPQATQAEEDVEPRVVQRGSVRCDGCSFAWNAKVVAASYLSFVSGSGLVESPRPPGEEANATPPRTRGTSSVKSLSSFPSLSKFGSRMSGSLRVAVLRDIRLDVQPGEFVVVRGPTGAGKTALLLAMLRELYVLPTGMGSQTLIPASSPLAQGIVVGGEVAYCAEVPWLRQGTVRENVRLLPDEVGETEEERVWYDAVLRACALNSDIGAMAKGDRTLVGEGGNRLSGGQRARVALARAAYRWHCTDVFLLDDVLSALDVEVQKHIVAQLFHGLFRATATRRQQKTIIFVTHTPVSVVLPDRVFDLSSDGTLREDKHYSTPAPAYIMQQVNAWQDATKAAAEAKDSRRVSRLAVDTALDSPPATNGDAVPSCIAPTQMKTPAKETTYTLLPRAEDLHRLFVEYIGGKRFLLFCILSVSTQLFRTLMDNWLGVYISFHEKRYEAYETILRSTASQRAKQLMLDILSLFPLRSNNVITEVPMPLPPPPPPLLTVLGIPVMWKNPFTFDPVVLQFLSSYALIGLAGAFFSMAATRSFFTVYQRMTDTLQLRLVRKLFEAPASFFDRVPSSRLLQVLSRDQEIVDHALGESVQLIFLTVLQLGGIICFNALRYGSFILVLPLSVLLFYHLTLRFLRFAKQVRALEGALQSQVVDVVKDAVRGCITIRAFGTVLRDQLQDEMNEALDAVHTAANAGLTADRWVALRLEFVALLITSTLSVLSVLSVCLSTSTSTGSAAFAGLGIISSMSASRSLSMLCRRIGMFQNQFISAEQLLRLEEEIEVEDEGRAALQQDGTASSPSNSDSSSSSSSGGGSNSPQSQYESEAAAMVPLLEVRHLSAKYQVHLPWVLTDICFTLRAGECVGLIGRTGNGKSSIFNALLGLMDTLDGEVLIPAVDNEEDGLPSSGQQCNALQLPKHSLRKHFFQLVSQEPFLLQGTCRSNLLLGLDDAVKWTPATPPEVIDERLCSVLKKVSLDTLLTASPTTTALDLPVPEGPRNEDNPSEKKLMNRTFSCSSADSFEEENRAAMQTLDYAIAAGGSNLSAGQRQLLCLARAILHQPRVVLLDEVSSRVDRHTDDLIQRVIKEEMLQRRESSPLHTKTDLSHGSTACGVLLIAHRLETILSLCDRVLVVENGRCVAYLSKEEVTGLEDLQSYL